MSEINITELECRRDGLFYPTYECADENGQTQTVKSTTGWAFYPFCNTPTYQIPAVTPWILVTYAFFTFMALFLNWHIFGLALMTMAFFVVVVMRFMQTDTNMMRQTRKRVQPVYGQYIGTCEVRIIPQDGKPEYNKKYPIIRYEWNGSPYYMQGCSSQFNDNMAKIYVDEQQQYAFSEDTYQQQNTPTSQIAFGAVAFALFVIGLTILLSFWL